jgi:hypothetical protein
MFEHMSELCGVALLQSAVEVLLGEQAGELPGPQALQRLRTVLACAERLKAAQLRAVRDMDSRQLYALDAAGSARGWLRRQPGGEDGQVTLARRLTHHPLIGAALADARIGLRSASQLCTALDSVPADLDDTLVSAVLQDGIGRLLVEQTGGTPEHDDDDRADDGAGDGAGAAVLAQRAADAAVLAGCCTDTTAAPAVRMEPAFVLLAERLPAAQLGSALRLLLDPLHPDGTDTPQTDPYYLELRILADGDVDLRGLLDPETGQRLAAQIERHLHAARTAAAQARRTADPSHADAAADAGLLAEDPGADARPDTADTSLTADHDAAGNPDHDAADDADHDAAGNPDHDAADDAADDAGDDPDHDAADDAADDAGDGLADPDPLPLWDQALADADARAARRAA